MKTDTVHTTTRYAGSITRRVPPFEQKGRKYPHDFHTDDRSWPFAVVRTNDPSFLTPEQLEELLVKHKLLHGFWEATSGFNRAILWILVPRPNGTNDIVKIECDSSIEIVPKVENIQVNEGKKASEKKVDNNTIEIELDPWA